jgi:hypothetical protein
MISLAPRKGPEAFSGNSQGRMDLVNYFNASLCYEIVYGGEAMVVVVDCRFGAFVGDVVAAAAVYFASPNSYLAPAPDCRWRPLRSRSPLPTIRYNGRYGTIEQILGARGSRLAPSL